MDPEIRDKVIETHTLMKGVNARLTKIEKNIEEHDKRITSHEKFKSWVVGIFSTGVVGSGTFAGFKSFFSGGG